MKTILHSIQIAALVGSLCTITASLRAQGTAFTYQGRLDAAGSPANGTYDLTFALFQDPTGGGAVLGPITNLAVSISNGLFTTMIDFGPYDPETYGRGRWLEISARTNGAVALTVLSPRQRMTPAPSAIYATYSGGAPPGIPLNADLLDGVDANFFWQLGGNLGTTPGTHFLGTADNQPLELRVNNKRAFRLEFADVDVNHSGVNVIGGAAGNFVGPGVIGATIAGGGTENFFLTPLSNSVMGSGSFGSVGGGFENLVSGFASTVAGGRFNVVSGADSFIGGGIGNTNTAFAATVPGGYYNRASGDYSFAAGRQARANHPGAFVWADSQGADFASTADDQFSIRAQGGVRLNTDTSLFFGSQTRQMLNLWAAEYGIGVQTGTEYFRTSAAFSWFRGGVHHDGQFNPGAGGVEMMRLDAGGNLRTLTGTISSLSDRNAKQSFEPVNTREVLDKVAAMPLARWSYKTDATSRHIGPMAQEFYAAFGVGLDDKSICTVDADGVALAAIQGLNQKLEELVRTRDVRIAALESELAEIRQLLLSLSGKGN